MSKMAIPFGHVKGAVAGPGIATLIGPCTWVPPKTDGVWGALAATARPWLSLFVSTHGAMENATEIRRELNLSLTHLEVAGQIPTLNHTPVQARVQSREPCLYPTTEERAELAVALWDSFKTQLLADPRAALAFIRSARPDLYRELVDEVAFSLSPSAGDDHAGDGTVSTDQVETHDTDKPMTDLDRFEVRWRGRKCQLRTLLFRLFDELNRRPGAYFAFDTLAGAIWRDDDVADNTMQKAASDLRKALITAGMGDLSIDGSRSGFLRLVVP